MTKKQAIAIITKCAKQYQQYLEGRVTPRTGMNANGFYRATLNNRLNENDFSFKNNHTTELKLKVPGIIMNMDTSARMIGNYTGPHLELYTEIVTGTRAPLISHCH